MDAYDIWNDEKKNYGPYWDEQAVDEYYWPEYIHRTATELEGLPFIGMFIRVSNVEALITLDKYVNIYV